MYNEEEDLNHNLMGLWLGEIDGILGSLGKHFGYSEFGKGLVTGTAEGFTESFQDDINRTKDNI